MKKLSMIAVVLMFASFAAMAGGKQCSSATAAKQCSSAKKVAYKGEACTATAQQCLDKAKAKYAKKAWLGVKLAEAEHGVKVTDVIPGSPAEAAGFQKGDVVLAVNKNWVKDSGYAAFKGDFVAGSVVKYIVARNGEKTKLKATLATPSMEVQAAWIGQHLMTAHASTTSVAAN